MKTQSDYARAKFARPAMLSFREALIMAARYEAIKKAAALRATAAAALASKQA